MAFLSGPLSGAICCMKGFRRNCLRICCQSELKLAANKSSISFQIKLCDKSVAKVSFLFVRNFNRALINRAGFSCHVIFRLFKAWRPFFTAASEHFKVLRFFCHHENLALPRK